MGVLGSAFDAQNELLRDAAEWGVFGEPGEFAVAVDESGLADTPEEREAFRRAAEQDGSIEADLTATILTAPQAGGDVLVDLQEEADESASNAVDEAFGVIPWWTKYAVGGIGLVAVLAVLSPYAEIGSEVVA